MQLYYSTNINANLNAFVIFVSKYFCNRVIITLFAVEKNIIIKHL